MGKIRLDITEDSYSKNRNSEYELSILVGVDSFAYAITDPNGAPQALRIYQTEAVGIDAILQTDDLLQASFKRVCIGIGQGAPVLVPSKLYNPLEKQTYLRHLQPEADVDVSNIQSDELTDQGCFALYPSPQWLARLEHSFPGARITHLASALIKNCRQWPVPANSLEPRLIVHIGANDVLVLLFSAERLALCNAYTFNTAEDFLYYLLLALAQEGFDNNQTPVYLSGSIVEDSAVYRIVHRFFRKTHFISAPPEWPSGTKMLQTPAHFFFALRCLRQP